MDSTFNLSATTASTPIQKTNFSAYASLAIKLRGGAVKKPSLQTPAARSAVLLSARPNDSGLDGSGIDQSRMSCGPELKADDYATPLNFMDGNVSINSSLLSLSDASLPVSAASPSVLEPELPPEVFSVEENLLLSPDVCSSVIHEYGLNDWGDVTMGGCEQQHLQQAPPPQPFLQDGYYNVSLSTDDMFGVIPQYDGLADPAVVDTNNKDLINYPTVLCTNVRSLIPKIDCMCETLREEGVAIGFVSELWLSSKNPLHQRELDRRLHLEGFEFLTNTRGAKRGGGVGIVVNTNMGYKVRRLQVNCI